MCLGVYAGPSLQLGLLFKPTEIKHSIVKFNRRCGFYLLVFYFNELVVFTKNSMSK